ncbi:hypothetical protein IC235_05455 [Hymenobacter sp. BT664]|uniref:Uncharacterized protein n=1 Tax=Hymenobacter montanus TaxID=2771359 RepID=A0A927GIP1_9BACT|nr:hypothetical protein [Hymenobacter montanus]MBD2767334.1 hypothetical protein [Hymenobacter montanus]
MQKLLILGLALLAGAGCSTRSTPTKEEMTAAPAATKYSEGRFSGTWYQRNTSLRCLDEMRIGHDTLGRYNINEVPCDTLYSIDAYTGYTSGDSLHVYGVPEHHSPEMWLHLEQGRQLLIQSYELDQSAGFPKQRAPKLVRDTFWLDSARVR